MNQEEVLDYRAKTLVDKSSGCERYKMNYPTDLPEKSPDELPVNTGDKKLNEENEKKNDENKKKIEENKKKNKENKELNDKNKKQNEELAQKFLDTLERARLEKHLEDVKDGCKECPKDGKHPHKCVAKKLHEIYPNRFKNVDTATQYLELVDRTYKDELVKRQQKKLDVDSLWKKIAIGNFMYGHMDKGSLGNKGITSGDGWKYHGRGLVQLTGRDNYTNFNKALKTDKQLKMFFKDDLNLVEDPDLILVDINLMVVSACWYWTRKSGLDGINKLADENSTDIYSVTVAVNGKPKDGKMPNGWSDRNAIFKKAKAELNF